MKIDIETTLIELKEYLIDNGFEKIPSDTTLNIEIINAIDVINNTRRYTPTEENMVDKKYASLIIPLCCSSISKYGATGQTSHSENGISRGYGNDDVYPPSILNRIIPLAKG